MDLPRIYIEISRGALALQNIMNRNFSGLYGQFLWLALRIGKSVAAVSKISCGACIRTILVPVLARKEGENIFIVAMIDSNVDAAIQPYHRRAANRSNFDGAASAANGLRNGCDGLADAQYQPKKMTVHNFFTKKTLFFVILRGVVQF